MGTQVCWNSAQRHVQVDLPSKRNWILRRVLPEGESKVFDGKSAHMYVLRVRLCLPRESYLQKQFLGCFYVQVTDGTECRPYSSSVCVKGKCVRTGCDGIIGSKLQFDKCGICGGDGNSCIKVAGNFTKKRLEIIDKRWHSKASKQIRLV